MELSACIEKRKSVRAYRPGAVDRATIEDILYKGILAPSGRNRQPWSFVVVEEKALRDQIGELIYQKVPAEGGETRDAVKAAPVLVVVYDRIGYTRGDEKMFDHISLGAAMEHMCLAAVDKGLGTLWIGFICLAEKEISEMLGQTDKKMVAAMAIGWPDEAVPPEDTKRDAVADITTWY